MWFGPASSVLSISPVRKLLATLLNSAHSSIAVGGTSGKSTVTGMIGWILHACHLQPTVMNGAMVDVEFRTSPSCTLRASSRSSGDHGIVRQREESIES
jgi:UDP-N-acetylmuramate--alanine ligase